MIDKKDLIPVSDFSDEELLKFMQKNGISLKINETRDVVKKLGRNPTLTELHIFNTEWSEHCSYKSSKDILKLLPTTGKNVIQGPQEDAGIVELGVFKGERYGIVMAHESHNHPSQVVPYEGAATGIGGILRDVLCMGAKIIATADPLRFGNPFGKHKGRTRYIANEVVNGIACYGNPVGIPNLAGDVYFNDSFDDNCIVNVICLGIIKESEIIHSRAPKNAHGYDVIIVGKATDNSGFGGATFASLVLDEKDDEMNKGAVQVPDPFLKNVIIRATEAVFREARKKGIELGFKDMGAGGIMCSSSEIGAMGGYGITLDLDKVHVSMKDLPPYIIACSETQERFTWVVPNDFTPTVLRIYNQDYELPNVAEGARAVVIGKVTKEKQFVMKHNGKVVCDAPIDEITSGIKYKRPFRKPERKFKEPKLDEPKDYNEMLLKVLRNPIVASKENIYKHYDTEVLGNAVIRPGEADAGLLAPLHGSSFGVALATDANPRYARIDPYWGSVAAVAESMRNIAAIGAVPSALTDCLCFGNPEQPEVFWQFVNSVKGIADAARNIQRYKTREHVPVISGNVSFYNQNAFGKAVDPSPIIACVGVIKDYSKAVTMDFKENNSVIYLIGPRKDELGGSVYYEINNEIGANIPKIDFELEKNMIHSVIRAIENKFVLSCHDISDGGLATTISEMSILGNKGAIINIDFSELGSDKILFSESSGFVLEVNEKNSKALEKIFTKNKVKFWKIGKTTDKNLVFEKQNKKIIDIGVEKIKEYWENGLEEAMK